MPLEAQNLSFSNLLINAYEQVKEYSQGHDSCLLLKIPLSIITAVASDSNKPWILESPESITEAYDPILNIRTDHHAKGQEDFAESTSGVESRKSGPCKVKSRRPDKWDQEGLQDPFEIRKSNADLIRHMILLAPSGPCVGSSRIFKSQEEVFHRFFACEFAKPAVEQFLSMPSPTLPIWLSGFVQHGVVRIDKLHLPNEVFEQELKLFLICLICGTSLACATKILEHAEVVIVVAKDTECEEMLALVNRSALSASSRHRLILGGSGFEDLQGLFLLSAAKSSKQARVVVGRTMVPKTYPRVIASVKSGGVFA
ncbi:hypothetical protein F4815DRAFT_464341 [Daldinia loculata]|nr:hypothetical protein F4815DRAFT_464341 [Daldinia loculata]